MTSLHVFFDGVDGGERFRPPALSQWMAFFLLMFLTGFVDCNWGFGCVFVVLKRVSVEVDFFRNGIIGLCVCVS